MTEISFEAGCSRHRNKKQTHQCIIAALLGGGIKNVIIALSVATISPYARVMNGQTLSVKENDYILAVRAIGSSNIRFMFSQYLKNQLSQRIA